MVKKIDNRDALKAGDQRIKNISAVSQVVTERANKEARKASKYLDEKISNKSSISSIDRVLKNLADATGTLTSGMRHITAETARGVKHISLGGAQAVNEYAKAISEDINVNKQALIVTTVGKISPIVGYATAKMMETVVFKNMISRMKEGLGKALSSVTSRFKSLAGAGWEKLRGVLSFEKKKPKEKIPKMAKGGFVKKGGMAEIHAAEVITPVKNIVATIVDQVNKRTVTKGISNIADRKMFIKEAMDAYKDTMEEVSGKRPALERIADNTFGTRQAVAPIGGAMGFIRTIFANWVARLGPFQRFFIYGLRTLQKMVMTPFRFLFRRRGGPLRPTGSMVRDMMASSFSQQNLLAEYLPAIARNTSDAVNALVGILAYTSGKTMSRQGIERKESWSIAGRVAALAYKGTIGLAGKGIGALAQKVLPEEMARQLTRRRTMASELEETKEAWGERGKRAGAAGRGLLGRIGWKGKPAAEETIEAEYTEKKQRKLFPAARPGRIPQKVYKKIDTIIDLLRKQNRTADKSHRYLRRRGRKTADTTSFLMRLVMPIMGMVLPMLMKFKGIGGGLFELLGRGAKGLGGLLITALKAIPAGGLMAALGPALGIAGAAGLGYLIGKPIGDAIVKSREKEWGKEKFIREKADIGLRAATVTRVRTMQAARGPVEEKVKAAHEERIHRGIASLQKKRQKHIGESDQDTINSINIGQRTFMQEHMDEYARYGFVTVNAARLNFMRQKRDIGIYRGKDPHGYGMRREQTFFKYLVKINEGKIKSEEKLYAEVGGNEFRERERQARVQLSEQAKRKITSVLVTTGAMTEKVTAYLPFPINLLGMLTNTVLMNFPDDIIRASEMVLTSGKYTKNSIGTGIWKAAELVKKNKSKILAWKDIKEKAQSSGVATLEQMNKAYSKFAAGGFAGMTSTAKGGIDKVTAAMIEKKNILTKKGYLPTMPEAKERLSKFHMDKKSLAAMGVNKDMAIFKQLTEGFDKLSGAVISGSQAASSVVTSFVDSSQKTAQVSNGGGTGGLSGPRPYYDEAVDSILRGRLT